MDDSGGEVPLISCDVELTCITVLYNPGHGYKEREMVSLHGKQKTLLKLLYGTDVT